MRVAVGVVLLAGCDLAFPIDTPGPIIDPPPPDKPFIVGGDHDYDGDGEIDNQDPCPADARFGSSSTDSDGDGLPDGCDPNLNHGRPDCLLLFDYFTDPEINSGFPWITESDATGWFEQDCDGGMFAFCSPARDGTSTLVFGEPLPLARVETEIRIGIRSSTPVSTLQVFAGFDPDRENGRACVLESLIAGNTLLAIEDVTNGNATRGDSNDSDLLFVPDADVLVQWTPQGEDTDLQHFCRAVGGVTDDHVDSSPGPKPVGAFVALRETDADVRVHHVLGYGRKCP